MRVQKRSEGGDALQWDGNNLAEMKLLCKGECSESGSRILVVSVQGNRATAMVGSWVVMLNNGEVEIHGDTRFQELYYEAE